jgi:hypothetical protein
MRRPLLVERHAQGPRVHVLGCQVHEYQLGLVMLAVAPPSRRGALAAVAGLWLVVKDWPDLFPATRDKASWRLGIHRLPSPGRA